jgi:hypothetical protein
MADQMSAALKTLLEIEKGPHFEKNITYMYVDTEGLITVGWGKIFLLTMTCGPCNSKSRGFERHKVIGGDQGIPIKENRILGRPATAVEKQKI